MINSVDCNDRFVPKKPLADLTLKKKYTIPKFRQVQTKYGFSIVVELENQFAYISSGNDHAAYKCEVALQGSSVDHGNPKALEWKYNNNKIAATTAAATTVTAINLIKGKVLKVASTQTMVPPIILKRRIINVKVSAEKENKKNKTKLNIILKIQNDLL
ncbi:uncharacterized protein LOC117176694 [Belonocnema kinseyi]|uniref:uncharacterized protein LOC117176694 n=1 Tax=Belonocnema kinseyi TaxID=2817044 RepID=UPI00143DD987|nr:uncharacterized protein LOC117176694 [Belonocnema kinseyi]